VYVEAFHSVPKGGCRTIVKIMAWLWFASWTAFPVVFVMGPEGGRPAGQPPRSRLPAPPSPRASSPSPRTQPPPPPRCPAGFGHLSPYGSIIAHSFIDLMSKNLWGLFGHVLRHKVRAAPPHCPSWTARPQGMCCTCAPPE
jgi:hypothetical protein